MHANSVTLSCAQCDADTAWLCPSLTSPTRLLACLFSPAESHLPACLACPALLACMLVYPALLNHACLLAHLPAFLLINLIYYYYSYDCEDFEMLIIIIILLCCHVFLYYSGMSCSYIILI